MKAVPIKAKALKNLLVVLVAGAAWTQTTVAPAGSPPVNPDLEALLSRMDQAAANFKSAEAQVQWDQYQKVVDETDVQKGRIYFRRSGKGLEAAVDITSPGDKQVVFKNGKLSIYEPRINQLTERDTTKNQADIEAFVSLGFGSRRRDLENSFDIAWGGWETIDKVKTAKLELVAKSDKVRNMFSRFVLWVDPERDVLLQQQVFEPSGDYRIAHYTAIKLNTRIDDQNFRLKTNPDTKIVRFQ